MKMDLTDGICFEFGGELGKFNSLPLDFLIRFAGDFQNLIDTLVRYDLPQDEAVDPDNFRIELVDFKAGSAIPKLAFTRRAQDTIGNNLRDHKQVINDSLANLLSIAGSGDYTKIRDLYPDSHTRSPITASLYDLIHGIGTTPTTVGSFNDDSETFHPVYKLNKFKESVRDSLITTEMVQEPEKETDLAVGRIRVSTRYGKKKNRIIEVYSGKNMSLEYAPREIKTSERCYTLKQPIRCLFEKEKDYFVIQSELLNIIGTGYSQDEAVSSFSDEFDYVYQRFNELTDDQLSPMNQIVKVIINHLVDHIG